MELESSIACAPSWPPDREAARVAILRWRREMTAAERARRSASIARALEPWLLRSRQALSNRVSHPVLGVYWPIRGEPDLTPHFADWIAAGWQMALPVTPSVPGPLTYVHYRPGQVMLPDAKGIAHPRDAEVTVPDCVVAPCVGFASGGFRLGYGGGYFDRTLQSMAGSSVGVAYRETLIADFEPQAHDHPMTAIVTDAGWVG